MKTCSLRIFVLAVVSLASIVANGQTYPAPTPAQQAGIDKDTARHFGDAPANPGPLATDLSSAITPVAIDTATRKVADWELARSQPYFDRIWTWSVLYTGFMAASQSTGDPRYRDAMTGMATKFDWSLRSRLPNADDQSVAQTYLELYLLNGRKDQSMISPTRSDLDAVMKLKTLKPGDPRIPWWWCDALFMAPPVWSRMYAATGDHAYIDYLDAQWKQTSDLLYDPAEHLYARDASYKDKREPNGQKIFWSRGEGWVMAGIVRTLEYLPQDDARRPFYIEQLREMSTRVAGLQREDGLWTSSLLDPKDYPEPEMSGSALMTYAMAWGINENILDAKTFRPVVERAWRGMLKHVYADGRLGCIQQTGAEPAYYPPSSSYNYGVGGFLLAASELKQMAIRDAQATAVATDPGATRRFDLPKDIKPGIPTIWLVGDSTVRNGRGDGAHNQMGWGDELAPFFNTDKVNVVNLAIGGRSSRTYITEGHWAQALQLFKPGDIVLIQFGHNDGGALDDPARARASIPGVGGETRTIYNPVQKREETVHTFGWYLTQYVEGARSKGSTPVLCSLIPRKIWKGGDIVRGTSSYGGWTHDVAQAQHADFVDLNDITADKYDAMGPEAVEPLFGDPHTHTTVAGAIINAESVVAGLKALPSDPVANDFSARGRAIQPYAVKSPSVSH
ncbi:MAG: glycoside hydrolase family 88 protein [Acidobacteriaceae bacterium]